MRHRTHLSMKDLSVKEFVPLKTQRPPRVTDIHLANNLLEASPMVFPPRLSPYHIVLPSMTDFFAVDRNRIRCAHRHNHPILSNLMDFNDYIASNNNSLSLSSTQCKHGFLLGFG
jgi:hypothetical protein